MPVGLGRRRRPRVLGTGGTAFNPDYKPSPKPAAASEIAPPFLSYDPALEAQRRAAQRGLEDTEADVRTKQHFAHTDLAQALQNIRVSTSRGRQDISTKSGRGREDLGREAQRGGEKLNLREGDTRKEAARANEDFDRQLADIGRRFTNLGRSQGEAANAAGVLDQGTLAAGAAARAGNQRLAEEPVNVGRQRTNEDLMSALERIGTARGQLSEDTKRELGRLDMDTETATTRLLQEQQRKGQESHRQYGREGFQLEREQERARREAAISNVDILAQEIYAARAEHPAVFAHWKQTHPDAIRRAESKAQAGGPAQQAGGGGPSPSPGGGTPAGRAPDKRRRRH